MTSLVITLDTAPPASGAFVINDGAGWTAVQVVTLDLSTSSTDIEEMLIWGDVDPTDTPAIQATEGASTWIAFASSKVIKLSAGNGLKTIYVKLRDDVGNATLALSQAINLDTDIPWVEITAGVDVDRISLVSGWNEASFSWRCNQAFERYEVRVVPSSIIGHQFGTLIGTAGGSTNVSADGAFAANTPITTTIRAADLQIASPGDGPKIVKVFVRDTTDVWSV